MAGRGGHNDVLLACTIGDISWLKRGLSSDLKPTTTNEEGLNGLHLAAKCGQMDCIKYLLDHCGADVNCAAVSTGSTALHYSIAHANVTRSLQCVKLLLSRGGSHKCRNMLGETPLHTAAKCGNIKTVKLLLEEGASIQAKDNEGHTPYDAACIQNHHECARLLRALQWANNKDTVEEEKLKREEVKRRQASVELARQRRLRREAAETSYNQWLEKKDLESNRPSTREGEHRTYSRATFSSSAASKQSSAPVHKINPRLTCAIKVNPKQSKRNVSSIGKPDRMQPYTNYPLKWSLRHTSSVHHSLGKSKSEPSRSGRSSRATVRSAASVPAGVRYYSKAHHHQATKREQDELREDRKCENTDMVEIRENDNNCKESGKETLSKWEEQATHTQLCKDRHDVEEIHKEHGELRDSGQEVLQNGSTSEEEVYKEQPAPLQVVFSSCSEGTAGERTTHCRERSENQDTVTVMEERSTGGDGIIHDIEEKNDKGGETEFTNEKDLPRHKEEVDELDFSKLKEHGPLLTSNESFMEGDEDDLFHDVGNTNSLNALSLPNTVTKDRTPAEVIQLLRSLGGLSKSYNRSYSFSHSFALAQRNRFQRRLSLGAIPEGQIVTSYSDEDQSTSQIIDGEFLESLILNLGGDGAGREENKNVQYRKGLKNGHIDSVCVHSSESEDSDTLSSSSSSSSVGGALALAEGDDKLYADVSDQLSIPCQPDLEISQHDTSAQGTRPQSLKIVNLAWNPCLNSVQSHISEAQLSVPDHSNRSGRSTPTCKVSTPSPHREQPQSPSNSHMDVHARAMHSPPACSHIHTPKSLSPSSPTLSLHSPSPKSPLTSSGPSRTDQISAIGMKVEEIELNNNS